MQCVQCGSTLRPSAKICIHCGTPVSATPSPTPAPAEAVPALAPAPVAVTPVLEPDIANVAAAAVHEAVAPQLQPSAPEVTAHLAPMPASEPALSVSTPVTQAKRPQVEVAPEFEATPLPVPAVKSATAAPSSNLPLMLAGGVMVAVVAGAAIFMSGGSKSPAPPAETTAKTAPPETTTKTVPIAEPQASAPVVVATGSAIDRQWLNLLMGLAANNDWASVQTKLGQTKPTIPAAIDKEAARQVNTQALSALRAGDIQGAATLFMQAAAQDPGDSEIQNNLGYAYLQAGRLDEARQHLLQTLQLAPTRAQAWLNTADLFAQSGNAEVAQSALKLAVFFATDRTKALASLSLEENLGHEQFKAVAKAVLAQADTIPAYMR